MITDRIAVLGVTVHPATPAALIEEIAAAVGGDGRLVVGNHNLHSVYLVRKHEEMCRFYERADVVFVDGMPLVLADRLGSRVLRPEHRATPLDWIGPLLDRASSDGWTVYLLGSTADGVTACRDVFARAYPGARFVARDGYFDDRADDAVVRDINDIAPDLLLVGMGMPRQEAWLARRHGALQVRVAMTVGGLFDYFAGISRTPPRWMGRVGLEWLGRLASDPRRLGRRYLIEPVLLAGLLVRERFVAERVA